MPHFDLSNQHGSSFSSVSFSEQLTDWPSHLETLAAFSAAVALSALLAYHPSTHRKLTSRTDFEQPKTAVLYGLVGALVGHIVVLNQAMALVIFGIGGLMRFRTVVGEAKDTGRVMLSAIIGICAGLQSYLIAALATAFAWVIIWYLESRAMGSVAIVGLDVSQLPGASLAYRRLLEVGKCRVLGETFNAKSGYLEIVFSAPSAEVAEGLKESANGLADSVRGHPLWQLC